MRRIIERTPARGQGFLLPVVLGLILVAAMLAIHALSGSADAAALSGNRLLHQRAFEAAERGIAHAMQTLEAGEPLAQEPIVLTSSASPDESAVIEYRATALLSLPSGYSSAAFIEQRGEVRSTGRLHNATARLAAGFSRIVPRESSP
jgi:Tfp pilus assembly protein PilX